MAQTVTVELFASLAAHADGKRTVEIEASNMGEVLRGLGEAYPAMKPLLDRGVSVSIDGRIYTESIFQPVGPENEIVLIAKLRGG